MVKWTINSSSNTYTWRTWCIHIRSHKIKQARRTSCLRWLEDVVNNFWELKVKRWRQKANSRKELASVIKDPMALKEPWSLGVSNKNFIFTISIIKKATQRCPCAHIRTTAPPWMTLAWHYLINLLVKGFHKFRHKLNCARGEKSVMCHL
jgi:hypothetical protein